MIFDLDDTLYSEKDYIRSGYRKIGEFFGMEDAEEKLWDYFMDYSNQIPSEKLEKNVYERMFWHEQIRK